MSHPSFNKIREQYIPTLNVTLQEFEHANTGAQHIHLQAENEENVFLVALRTVPTDSTGVAHILEHTALCGSKKYPVRDPFFMMTRRSLNTFMNAFTSSDWTAYPFASLNKKDFNNLLDVYLDAVFFSRLDPLDFAQEGHRLEFQELDNPNSPLEFKGVVFNEMKGAMSSVSSQLWQTLSKYLFPTNTYHFNSGGEPEDILNLSYEELINFYKTHYHPSNAIFLTYGDIPASTHQEKFENQVLNEFNRLEKRIEVADEKRYFSPIKVQESYANNDQDISEKSHVVIGWLLGDSTNLDEALEAQLLSSLLLDNSACPLMLALESSELGQAPSPLCGLDDTQKELSFICGLSATRSDATEDVEQLILSTLKNVAENGIPQADIESALHQLELHQREISGDSYPYGLQIILKVLSSANHRGDPLSLLDLDTALSKLRKAIQKPDFVQQLVKKLLLNNPHRVCLTLVPNQEISARKAQAERARLNTIQQSLNEEEKQAIVSQAQALLARQNSGDDPGNLPNVTLNDIPKMERSVSAFKKESAMTFYKAGTNGLVYQQLIYDFPNLDTSELARLSIFNHCVSELGAADKDYLDMQRLQSSVSGGLAAFSALRGSVNNLNRVSGHYIFSSKALANKHGALSELMALVTSSARFDEHSRIKEIVAQMRVGMEQSVNNNGHALAMSVASSGISLPAQMMHWLSGLEAIQRIKALDASLTETSNVETLAECLQNMHQKITSQNKQLLLIGEETILQHYQNNTHVLFQSSPTNSSYEQLAFEPKSIQQAWLTNTDVNYCAKAFPSVGTGHADTAALTVLGHYLRNGFLHKTIREQGGAYGGGASQDSNTGCFRFYSYRDPRLAATLEDFDASIQWLKNHTHNHQQLEEAIFGTIGSLDRSESPAGQAKRCFHSELHGRTLDIRQDFRRRVVETTFDDLVRVADTYLAPEKANIGVVTNKDKNDELQALNLELIDL